MYAALRLRSKPTTDMTRFNFFPLSKAKAILLGLLLYGTSVPLSAQTIMFDDFTYSSATDPQLSAFNKWSIVQGQNGPPEGAMYSRDNIKFITDPANASNKLMTLSTTVNGQTKATTHSRIESSYEYFEGTYAARVYISDEAFTTKDANIQTFFTIVSSQYAGDGSKYSELDIVEYMAADKWGIDPDKPVMYVTSWHKYVANPWQAWKTYFAPKGSKAGWHTFIATCTDKVNVKYYMDNTYLGSQSVTDSEIQAGLSVYPRSNMQVAFANWIWNNVTGSSTANRTNTMQADWVLFYKDQELNLTQVNALVDGYRNTGLQRRNLAGQTYITGPTNQAPAVSITAPANNSTYTAPATINIAATATDADGTVSKVEFYNGTTLLGTDNSAPYTFNWTNVAAGTYIITAKATDNGNAVTTSAAVTVKVNPAPIPQSPYLGTAWTIPGTIEAENYDLGGQDVAFNDLTAANEGGAYRTDAVDIETTTGGGYNVGYILPGEWLEYTVNVTAGTYNIDARLAATASGKTFRVELDGSTIATFTVPNTTAWQTWQTTTINNVSLTAGQKILRIYAIAGDFNIDKLVFTRAVVNQPPTVSITAPANNATYTAPASVTISANATDSDGSITKVDFYNGTTLLGTDNTSPYSFSWTNVAAGTYTVTARATDNNNAVTTSAAVTVKVNAPVNQAPTVTITAPTNNATYTAPATITISANAADADGTVSKVEFYNGTALLGTDNTSPYSYSWTNVSAGTYIITAKATDNNNAVTTSASITIKVNAPGNNCSNINLYNSNTIYVNGDIVVSNNTKYQAKWWTLNQDPSYNSGTWDVWANLGSCSAGPAPAPRLMSPVPTSDTTVAVNSSVPFKVAIDGITSLAEVNYKIYKDTTLIASVNKTGSGIAASWLANLTGDFRLQIVAKDASGVKFYSEASKLKVDQTTSFDDLTLNNNIAVYPNPSSGIVNLTSVANQVDVFDISGKLQNSFSGNSIEQINISELSNGVYILKIERNGQTYYNRIVKE